MRVKHKCFLTTLLGNAGTHPLMHLHIDTAALNRSAFSPCDFLHTTMGRALSPNSVIHPLLLHLCPLQPSFSQLGIKTHYTMGNALQFDHTPLLYSPLNLLLCSLHTLSLPILLFTRLGGGGSLLKTCIYIIFIYIIKRHSKEWLG